MQKRTVALAFLAVVLALVAATFLTLRTRWAGDRICALAAARAAAAAGLPIAFRSCRVEPLALEVEVDGLALGPAEAPVLSADRVVARLAAVQTLGGRVRLARLRLDGPRLAVELPAGGKGGPAACPPPALARVEVRELEVVGGAVDLTFPDRIRLTMERLDVRARPAPRTLRALAGPARAHLEVEAATVRLTGVDDRPFTTPLVRVAADLAPDLSAAEIGAAEAVVDGVRLTARGSIRDLCAPQLDLDATGSGPAREVLAITRIHDDAPAVGTVIAQGRVSGPVSRPTIAAAVRVQGGRVGWFHPGDVRGDLRLTPDLDGLVVERAEWPLPGGTVIAKGRIGFRGGVPLEWEVDTGGADLADLLDALGVEGSWVSVRLDARGKIAGVVQPELRLEGSAAGEFRDFRTWSRSWRTVKPGTVPVLEAHAGRIELPVHIGPDGIRTEGARLSGGRGTAVADAVAHFSDEGGFQVRARGDLDLDVLRHVAGVRVGGLASFEATAGAAPYGNPRVGGHVRAEGLRFLDLALGTTSAGFDYGPGADHEVRVHDAEGLFRTVRWRGDGVVDLGPDTPLVRSLRFEARGRVHDVFDAVQDWQPRTRPYRDVFEGDLEVTGTAHGPADLLDGAFEARMASGTFYGRPFDSARVSGSYEKGETARFERAELRRGAGVARMTGRATFSAPYPWDLDVSFAGLALRDAALPGGDWAGTGSGTAALRGSYEAPDVRAALNGEGVAVRGVALGSVQAAATLKGKALVVTGGAEGARFEAEATLDGRMPFRARADVALEDVAKLLPGGAPGIRARVKGEAAAEGELQDLEAARARVRLDEVQAGHAEFKVQAAAPVVVTASRGRVEMQPATFVGPNTELTVSGTRAASGQLDLSAQGTVDLRLLGGAVPDLKRPHGQLGLEAHVGGTVAEPVLVGAGRLSDAGFQLKTTSVLFSEVRGALAFSQNRVLFEELQASVNGGRARLRGELELSSFVPVRLRVEAQLDEVPFAVPAYLPITLSGRVEAAGVPDATTITGRLHVVRARYTADVALERSVLELRRRTAAPPRAYDKAGEWLRFDLQVVVDGDARVENDLVSGPVRGELTVTGTLAAPGALGTLSMAEGSRARFRGNEFVLSHAVLEFTDRNKVELALDVHGESRVRDYQVYLHAFGRLSDPQVTLTSTPPLPQPDIVTLLSLGYTRRDAGTGAGVQGVATAAAAQALFSASGLDEQVKRFIPRNQMVRDLSVRITSEWSEVSGQVEPRAEFEFFLLRDRLRLRGQAPLSGSRGQKAQAEVRLGKHTAVQYQWDNDNPDVATGDHGVDLKLRWEWTDDSR